MASPFSVLKGRTVWTATRPVDGSQRVYSLIRFATSPNSTSLYLRVEDPSANVVLTNLALGEVVAYIDPEVFFDPQGNIHVMQPIAMSTYLYSRADSSGKVVHQGIFKTYQTVRPRLTKLEDGNVIVLGGLEDNPNVPRETLSNGAKEADAAPAQAPGPRLRPVRAACRKRSSRSLIFRRSTPPGQSHSPAISFGEPQIEVNRAAKGLIRPFAYDLLSLPHYSGVAQW